MSFVVSNSVLYSASVSAMLFTIMCCIRPHYNGTPLYSEMSLIEIYINALYSEMSFIEIYISGLVQDCINSSGYQWSYRSHALSHQYTMTMTSIEHQNLVLVSIKMVRHQLVCWKDRSEKCIKYSNSAHKELIYDMMDPNNLNVFQGVNVLMYWNF